MIISKNSKPEYNLYFLGAQVLKHLKIKNKEEYDAYLLYEELKEFINPYSFTQHIMTLDWLFILGAIKLTSKEKIKLCS